MSSAKLKVRFFVLGKPATAGSKKAFFNKKTGHAMITDACKRSRPWKDAVKAAALEAMQGREMFGRAVALDVAFYFVLARPKGHFGTGRNADKLKPSAPRYPATRPDVLKYARAVEDALTGIVYHDDAAIVSERMFKDYGAPEGVWVEVREKP